eukprot:symbB.v1.2.003239.t1/scaffold179.1/size284905/6
MFEATPCLGVCKCCSAFRPLLPDLPKRFCGSLRPPVYIRSGQAGWPKWLQPCHLGERIEGISILAADCLDHFFRLRDFLPEKALEFFHALVPRSDRR